MLKIFLIPEARCLTEYETGLHQSKLDELDNQFKKLSTERSKLQGLWVKRDLNARLIQGNDGKLYPENAYVKFTDRLNKLSDERKLIIEKAKETIAIIGSQKKAGKAMNYFVRTYNTKYHKCELELQRAKI